MTVHRRRFIQGAAAVGGGLCISLNNLGCATDYAKRWGRSGDFMPTAQLRITPDNRVIFTLARADMGQGTLTSQTMILAEQLSIQPEMIEVEAAPNHKDYKEPEYGVQVTGGSSSTRNSFLVVSQAGATARHALLQAASRRAQVSVSALKIEGKSIRHHEQVFSFGELADTASEYLDQDAPLIERSDFRIIGRKQKRLDAPQKIDGTAKYAADISLPNLEVAVIVRGPLEAEILSYDDTKARGISGVKLIKSTPYGIAIFADRYYQARKAADLLKIEWSESNFSTQDMWNRYVTRLDSDEGRDNARKEGRPHKTLENSQNLLSAEYQLPFLAHTTMEPQVCTAWVQDNHAEVWTPTQAPRQAALAVADVTGLSEEEIKVHNTVIGGGFGRRSESDYVGEAAYLSYIRKKPIRLQWSREDDIQHDFYRPASLHRIRAVVENGTLNAWEHRIVQSSPLKRVFKAWLRERMASPLIGPAVWAASNLLDDPSIVEGAKGMPYAVPEVAVGYQVAEEPVPVGFWRSVGHSSNGFVVESFIDECAHAAQIDPVAFRRERLKDHPRHLGVLERAVSEAGWGKPLAPGRAQGVAVHESFFSYVAVVAEVSVSDEEITVHRLTAAVDCGLVISPDGVEAQIAGGMIYGLSSVLGASEITFANGRVEQSNFHDYEALRHRRAPEIDVHIVESQADPSGVGEPGVPPTLAAVANAVFAATGQRLRRLPLTLSKA